MQPSSSVGNMIQDTLYHLKSIEHRLDWSKPLCSMPAKDRHRIDKAITKVKEAILDIVMTVPDTSLQRRILDDIRCDNRMMYYMALVEQLFLLKEEDLAEVTDLVEEHLRNKYHRPVAEAAAEL